MLETAGCLDETGWNTVKLVETASDWLFPLLKRKGAQVPAHHAVREDLIASLDWQVQEALRKEAPLSLSLPSGHALGAIVVIGIVAVVLGRAVRSPGWRVVVGAVAAAAILTISLSRLYLGVHWVTDVATSWTLGGAWLAVVVTGLMWVTGRGSERP